MKVNTESVMPLLMEFHCNLTLQLFVFGQIFTQHRCISTRILGFEGTMLFLIKVRSEG